MTPTTSTEQIKQEFDNFIRNNGVENCYIGITNNVGRRFKEHNLVNDDLKPKDSRIGWLWRKAISEREARNIETFYKNEYRDRISGDVGGGENPTYVYIYTKVSGVTNERV